jgi:predicted nucleotidyltransferase
MQGSADVLSIMVREIDEHRDSIAAFCRDLGVESLLVFDSAGASGLSFLVQFKPMPSAQYATSYFSLAAQLEQLLKVPVDLVELDAGDNPYFKDAVGESRLPVHELSRA